MQPCWRHALLLSYRPTEQSAAKWWRTMDQQERIEAEAQLLAKIARRKLGAKANLRIVNARNLRREVPGAPCAAPQSQMTDIDRESYYRMIRHYRHFWGKPMRLLVDQACFGLAGIEQLPDDDLRQLMADMQRGIDCIRDGVTFEDAGLLRGGNNY